MRAALLAVLLWMAGASLEARVAAAQTAGDCVSQPYECAVAEVQRREFTPAIRRLEKLVAQAPRDLKALNLLGIALTGAGKPQEGNDRFRAALAIDPRFAPARRNLAVNEFTLDRLEAARRHFDAVIAQAPGDEIAHVYLGEIQFKQRHYVDALAHYEKSAARVAQNPLWLLHHAACLLEAGRTAEAATLLDRLPAQEASSWFDAGVLLGRYGARAEAARFFGAARRKGYGDAYAAGYNETLMLVEAGDIEGAIRTAQELFAQGLKPAELYSLVSRAYAKSNRVKEAYDALREAARIEPAVAEHYVDLAMLCLEHENYDLALEVVDVGLKYRPDSSMLHLQRGVVLAMKGSIEQAEQEFSRASVAAPDASAPYVALAMVWMQRGQTPKAVDTLRARAHATARGGKPQAVIFYALGIAIVRSGAAPDDAAGTEALEAFRTAVRLEPAFASAQAELGKLLFKRGDVTEAISHLERAIALEPENAAPAYVLAQAYRRNGQIDRARDLLARVSRLNAQERGDESDSDFKRTIVRIVREGSGASSSSSVASPPPLASEKAARAATCAAAGDLDGAIASLREAIEAAPAFSEGRYQLSVTLWNRYQRSGGRRLKADLDEAVSVLSRAVEQEPNHPAFHLVLGQLLAEQQQIARAVEHLRRAVALAPGNPEHHYNLGIGLRLQGDLAAAAAAFRAALERNPGHALARRSLGLVLRQIGDSADAAAELRRAASQLPEDPQGHHLLGTVLLKLGDVSGAVVELREAVRLDPSLIEARVVMAQALARQGLKADAMREQAAIQRLNAEKADFGRMLVLLDSSEALLKKGDVAGAIAQRREAIALSPAFPEAHYDLGLALSAADPSSTEAEAAFRRAIALDPNHARAFAALGRVLEARGDDAGARAARARATALAPCS
jgi:tetratricopeptide (TPR) repeat protein